MTPEASTFFWNTSGITRERIDAFLDARAARVVEAKDRSADLHRDVHDLADLGGMHARQGPTEDREILAEDIDEAAVDRAVAGHHAVARDFLVFHAEIDRTMLDEHVELLERPGIEQRIDALARRQLAFGVLRLDAALPTAQTRRCPPALEFFQHFLHRYLRPLGQFSANNAITSSGGIASRCP